MAHLRIAAAATSALLLAALIGLPQAMAGRHGRARERVIQWRGEVALAQLDCRATGSSQIVVSGVVRLLSADPGEAATDPAAAANPISAQPHAIHVFCDKLSFLTGARIVTSSNLDLRISGTVSGQVVIDGDAGEIGSRHELPHADTTPDRAASGAAGDLGLSARAASLKSSEDRAPNPPQPGRRGGAGGNGASGLRGADGQAGAQGAASNALTLLAGSFAPDSTVEMMSRGGDGGPGGRGGRGQDGGRGGHGGRGGDGNGPAGGGDGGPGGNGGAAGDGGAGGNGGDGGTGGNLILGIRAGGSLPALPPRFDNRGGRGGDPGLAGQGGLGGPAGLGGPGGPATTDVASASAITWERGGSAGVTGSPGVDGAPGVTGLAGHAGRAGRLGYASWGMIAASRFSELMKPQ